MRKLASRALTGALTVAVAFTSTYIPVSAATGTRNVIAPKKAAYGYYVDVYKNNEKCNMTSETNPSIGVLSQFLELFTPGDSWNNGTVKNREVHEQNLTLTSKITSNRTKEMKEAAYKDDRRNESYSVISGLGGYQEAFKKGTNAGTTISDTIPNDATTVKYEDNGNGNWSWADENTKYGGMVKLVNTIRNTGASTSQAKAYYKYMRPFRWTDKVEIEDILKPCQNSNPASDGGFPSGHTNAAYLSAYGLAYAAPERFQELITRASELGNNRVVAGMHSCLDVMGGRVTSTAIAASALNDKNNAAVKKEAYEAARQLLKEVPGGEDDYSNYEVNKKKNLERLTYGFEQIGDTNKPMVVPKGAEVLLETRLPYLSAEERRYVLYTTGLESGYPVLDDTEGWGRLNLFEAANGYGSFVKDTTVTMDATKGSFNAKDTWRNDIDGAGELTKQGTGTLVLAGANSYTGGTNVLGGTLTAESNKAFGKGHVTNASKVAEEVNGEVLVNGNYVQKDSSTLSLSIAGKSDVFKIAGSADLNGTLILNFSNGFIPADNFKVISYPSKTSNTFDKVVINGLKDASSREIKYKADGVYLCKKAKAPVVTKKAQTIKVAKKSYTKTYGDKPFTISAKTTAKGTSLSYRSSNNKVVTVNSRTGKVAIKGSGKATITIIAKGNSNYKEATKTVTVTVRPKKEAVVSASRKSKTQIKLTYKKDKMASGYQIRYSTNNKYTKATTKVVTVKGNQTVSKILKNLKRGKKYYISVRAYKTVGKQKIYGEYSRTKTIK